MKESNRINRMNRRNESNRSIIPWAAANFPPARSDESFVERERKRSNRSSSPQQRSILRYPSTCPRRRHINSNIHHISFSPHLWSTLLATASLTSISTLNYCTVSITVKYRRQTTHIFDKHDSSLSAPTSTFCLPVFSQGRCRRRRFKTTSYYCYDPFLMRCRIQR